MANLIRFITLTADECAIVRGVTTPGHALEPRMIDAGPLAGWGVLPLAVLSDAAHSQDLLFLLQAKQQNIDPSICWPEPAE